MEKVTAQQLKEAGLKASQTISQILQPQQLRRPQGIHQHPLHRGCGHQDSAGDNQTRAEMSHQEMEQVDPSREHPYSLVAVTKEPGMGMETALKAHTKTRVQGIGVTKAWLFFHTVK